MTAARTATKHQAATVIAAPGTLMSGGLSQSDVWFSRSMYMSTPALVGRYWNRGMAIISGVPPKASTIIPASTIVCERMMKAAQVLMTPTAVQEQTARARLDSSVLAVPVA